MTTTDENDNPFISIELVGGPQDGAVVHIHEDRRNQRIWVGSVWLKDAYTSFTSVGATKKFPMEYFYDNGKYRFVRDTR